MRLRGGPGPVLHRAGERSFFREAVGVHVPGRAGGQLCGHRDAESAGRDQAVSERESDCVCSNVSYHYFNLQRFGPWMEAAPPGLHAMSRP